MCKKDISKFIEIINTELENVLLFKLTKEVLGLEVLAGTVYIPPEGSVYSNIEIFDKLELELITINANYLPICLFGDFNARTGVLKDSVEYDKYITNDVKQNIMDNVLMQSSLQDFNFSKERFSEDKVKNNYGYKLISMYV